MNSAVKVFQNQQWNVIYEQFNAPQYPNQYGLLNAPLDGTAYTSGRLLAQYTAANAPSPDLVGTYINYDPAGTTAQQTLSAIIAEQWVNDYEGIDFTTPETIARTFRNIQVAPLLIGTTLYFNTLEANNSVAVITGFDAFFIVNQISNIQLNGVTCPLITIQGVV
jgi:hypothetical protein